MKWTSDLPQSQGWYWVKTDDDGPYVFEIAGSKQDGWVMYIGDEGLQENEFLSRYQNANYLGPITPAHSELWDEMVEVLAAMDDLMEKLWKAVPWGQTFNLPLQELNEVPLRAKQALNHAKQVEGRG